jgi:hypothetical protein
MHILTSIYKSKCITLNVDASETHLVGHLFGCPIGSRGARRLLHFDKLRAEDIQSTIDKIIKRIAGWHGRLISYSGRLVVNHHQNFV